MSEAAHIVYSVQAIACGHCKRAIGDAVGALDGVQSVEVDVVAKTVDVRLSGDGADAEDVRRAIEEAGYPVGDQRAAE